MVLGHPGSSEPALLRISSECNSDRSTLKPLESIREALLFYVPHLGGALRHFDIFGVILIFVDCCLTSYLGGSGGMEKYSYAVWQWFAYNSDNCDNTESRSMTNFPSSWTCSYLAPSSRKMFLPAEAPPRKAGRRLSYNDTVTKLGECADIDASPPCLA